MNEADIFKQLIYPALKKANLAVELPGPSEISDDFILYGESGAVFDSLNLVGFIFLLEEESSQTLGVNIKFSADDILNAELRPFLNCRKLAAFLQHKLEKS